MWNKVDDHIPPLDKEVLVCYVGNEDIGWTWSGMTVAFLSRQMSGPRPYRWFKNDGFAIPSVKTPTHWMYLPQLPKE